MCPKTDLLYYKNPDITEFSAAVLSIDYAENRLRLILDRTAFYPEGGGQPADRGTINGLIVADVRKNDGTVHHFIEIPDENSAVPEPGDKVNCTIDIPYRKDYMQQHSGQHVISAAMMKSCGVETVSVRQGSDFTAIETASAELDLDTMLRIEDTANSFIRLNAPINALVTDKDGLKQYKLRRPTKHTSNIRIIEIPGIDCVACGGMHLRTTGEIGLVKYIWQEKIRNRIRTYWKIGGRAYRDYAEKTEIINSLNEFYSARQFELAEKAAGVAEQLTEARYRYNKLEEEYAAFYASGLISEPGGAVIKIFKNRPNSFITNLLKSLSENLTAVPAFIFNRTGDALTWAATCPEGLPFDFNEFRKELLPIIDGKGGGKPPLWQGIAKNPDGIEELIGLLQKKYSVTVERNPVD